MNELSKALNEIILELDTLSDQELQAKFEASKGGLVGAAILDSEMFLRQQLEEFTSCYNVSSEKMSSFYRKAAMKHNDFFSRLDEIVLDAANDEQYMMAA